MHAQSLCTSADIIGAVLWLQLSCSIWGGTYGCVEGPGTTGPASADRPSPGLSTFVYSASAFRIMDGAEAEQGSDEQAFPIQASHHSDGDSSDGFVRSGVDESSFEFVLEGNGPV